MRRTARRGVRCWRRPVRRRRGCRRRQPTPPTAPPAAARAGQAGAPADPGARPSPALAAGETYVYEGGVGRRDDDRGGARGRAAGRRSRRRRGRRSSCRTAAARRRRRSRTPTARRSSALANDELDADGDSAAAAASTTTWRCSASRRRCRCWRRASRRTWRRRARPASTRSIARALEQWTGDVGYLDRDRAQREYEQALHDADWIDKEIARASAERRRCRRLGAAAPGGAPGAARAIPSCAGASTATCAARRGVRAVRAAQARLVCEGLLTRAQPLHARHVRPADARGAGRLGAQERHLRLGLPGRRDAGDAAAAAARAARWTTFKRVLAERVADAAGIVEDGSINQRARNPPTWRDAEGVRAPGARPDRRARRTRCWPRSASRRPRRLVAFLRAHKAGARPGCTSRSRRRRCRRTTGPTTARRTWTCPSRSIAATSGTTCRSTRAASRSCSAAITTRT